MADPKKREKRCDQDGGEDENESDDHVPPAGKFENLSPPVKEQEPGRQRNHRMACPSKTPATRPSHWVGKEGFIQGVHIYPVLLANDMPPGDSRFSHRFLSPWESKI